MVKEVYANWLSARVASNGDQVLVLDTRSADQFNCGYIRGAVHICCSGVILRRLRKGNLCIESLLNCDEDKQKYERAKRSEKVCVVVCDSCTPSADRLSPDSIAALLLKKVSRECKFAGFLAGGYTEFSRSYPSVCVMADLNSRGTSLLQKRPSSLLLQLTNLQLNVEQSAYASPPAGSEDDSPSIKEKESPRQILPHLYLGCRKAATSLPSLKEHGITRVLNVTSSVPNQFEREGFTYKQIKVEDSHDVNMMQYLPEAFRFIEDAKDSGAKVLVHCHAGMSRSVTVIIAYLMKHYEHTLDSAYEFVKERKSDISPNFSFMGQLLEYDRALRHSPSDSGIGSGSTTPMDGHCFLLNPSVPLPSSVDMDFSRRFVLAL